MARRRVQDRDEAAWRLVARQHGVVTRQQLIELGIGGDAIDRRIAGGRLHPVHRGVFAVGRPGLSREGAWTAAVLACGPEAVLSHLTAAAAWGIRQPEPATIHISLPMRVRRCHAGLVVHRRALGPRDRSEHNGIPLTSPALTLVDVAACLGRVATERAVNEADALGLIDPEALRSALEAHAGRAGVGALRTILDVRTFALTDSELEQRFMPIARAAGLPKPRTRQFVNGFRVDFFWPELRLVVEADSLRYHRTASQQARDYLRDATHHAAGLRALRFNHWQITRTPRLVERALRAAARED